MSTESACRHGIDRDECFTCSTVDRLATARQRIAELEAERDAARAQFEQASRDAHAANAGYFELLDRSRIAERALQATRGALERIKFSDWTGAEDCDLPWQAVAADAIAALDSGTPPDKKRREPGCKCHREEGDSECPVHAATPAAPIPPHGLPFCILIKDCPRACKEAGRCLAAKPTPTEEQTR
jgi:hypothetical protein